MFVLRPEDEQGLEGEGEGEGLHSTARTGPGCGGIGCGAWGLGHCGVRGGMSWWMGG